MAWCRNCETTLEYDELAEVWRDADGSTDHEVETWAHLWETADPKDYSAAIRANYHIIYAVDGPKPGTPAGDTPTIHPKNK